MHKQNEKETATYYDKYANWYDSERQQGYYKVINEIETGIVKEFGQNKKTLEIGCGTGIILSKVSQFAKEALGVDLSAGMVKTSQAKGLKARQADVTTLPFANKEFDVVYSFKVLPHVEKIKEALLEIDRVTKTNGIVIVEFYNPYSLKFLTNLLYNWIKKRNVYLRFDSPSRVKKYAPTNWQQIDFHGAKLLAVEALAHLPGLNEIVIRMEKSFAKSVFNLLAGYQIYVFQKN